MGGSWEDRLPLRRLEKFALGSAFAASAALSPGTVSGEAGRLLVTFLAIVAASILPTITLLVNSMTASGRSVQALNKLEAELQAAMDALFLFFGCIALGVGGLIALSIPTPPIALSIPYLATDVLPRFGQGVVGIAAAIILLRAGQIPAILRRSLGIRHEIAVDEARRKLAENAPEAGAMKRAFANHPDFGKVVNLEDLQGRDGR